MYTNNFAFGRKIGDKIPILTAQGQLGGGVGTEFCGLPILRVRPDVDCATGSAIVRPTVLNPLSFQSTGPDLRGICAMG